jgi:fimbrial chaperone protein
MSEMESMSHLRFKQTGGQLTIINPTPYYQSLVNLSVGNKKLKNSMVEPFGQLALSSDGTGPIHYQTVNDYGAITSQQTGILQ